VLVLGGYDTGHQLAQKLGSEGVEVILVGISQHEHSSDSFIFRTYDGLEEIQGFIGGFDIQLTTTEGRSSEKVGFIVAAPPIEYDPKYDLYGLKKSDRIVSLSDLESALEKGDVPITAQGDWLHVAFLCGLEGESDPAVFERVFNSSEALRKLEQVQTYVFTRQVKVASYGMERRYRQIRNEGTIFFKFDGHGPTFENSSDGLAIVFTDPVLNTELELIPDLLVVDEDQRPSQLLKPLLEIIPSSIVSAPFLQPESVRFSGVSTPKAGIMALGATRGNFNSSMLKADIESALEAILVAPQREIPSNIPGPPVVDQAKCTICLTCIRLCPHGAMGFRKRAEADPLSCVRCGICAAECPMDAIILVPAPGDTPILEKIYQGLAQANASPKIIAFLCSKSGVHAMEAAGPIVCRKLIPISVPCAGTVAQSHILAAFQNGADGVLVAGCHTGNCASIFGNILAGERASQARTILQEAGIDGSRLMFTNVANNTPGDFTSAVQALERAIV
jgi:quinone-modifying oxidoreductase subunit QmoB